MNVNSLIQQPLAFWSSLAYLAPVFLLNRQVKVKDEVFSFWKLSLILLTFSSMFCHASYIRLSIAMDFACIGMIMGFFSFVHFTKFSQHRKPVRYFHFLLFFALLTVMFYSLEKWTKIILCMLVFVLAFYEVILTLGRNFWQSKDLALSVFCLVIGFIFFLLDDQKILWCDPYGWIHGHTVWHLGTAAAAYFFGAWRFKAS
jgi:hypothetical protein